MTTTPTPIGSDFQVNSHTPNDQQTASVASLQNGGYVVVWESYQQDGSQWGVFGQVFSPSGDEIGGEFRINAFTAGNQEINTDNTVGDNVTALEDGGFVVVWTSWGQDGSGQGVFGQRFDSSGVKVGEEFQVNSVTADDQREASVTGLADGGFVVTWGSWLQDGSQWGIFGQRFDHDGAAVGSEFQINAVTANDQESSSVAALKDGGFVVTWESWLQDGAQWGIVGRRFDGSGAPVGNEFPVNSFTPGDQWQPSVASLEDGGFVVTWTSWSQDGGGWGVFGQRFNASGETVGYEFQINSYTSYSQWQSSVAPLSDGGFVVTWSSFVLLGGFDYGIHGQRFDATGSPVGSEFDVNSFGPGDQWAPSVAALRNGNILVAWESWQQDGAQQGVFARHFDLDLPSLVPTNGDDLITGTSGNDTLAGLAGGDTILGDAGNDLLKGEENNDSIEGGDGNDTLEGNEGVDTLLGEAGDDSLNGGDGDDFLRGDAGDDTVEGGDGNDKVFAGRGDMGDDIILGGAGDDTLGGAQGNDQIFGGTGSDESFGGSGNDLIDESGTDASSNTAWAGAGQDTVIGGDGDDVLGGGAGADLVSGGAGNDVIYPGAGPDNDTLNGEAGNDTIFAGGGDDLIDGGTGDDLIFNGAGTDTVSGGSGSDTIWGAGGDDQFTGGDDADTFAFVQNNGTDTITDFSFAQLDLLNVLGLGLSSESEALAAMTDVDGNVHLTAQGTTVIIEVQTVSDFSSNSGWFDDTVF
ncbi:calcium-binding protein [Shimia abyssi]|uniref:Ca2+-binding RTX toxin-like protein n=1 Tax=Shimia abyssi TaxID=1662395 RepID=A0A2P8F798_9RHOB|nr:calcium-binding protein [Shimia abyssi]PSL17591.1 Ca2+-binding RTX toxin-like protein [Shimia abyssi]